MESLEINGYSTVGSLPMAILALLRFGEVLEATNPLKSYCNVTKFACNGDLKLRGEFDTTAWASVQAHLCEYGGVPNGDMDRPRRRKHLRSG
mmetsp:Transcript_632/g.1299  ORF Transcript_632/g.1299 Transcript_632/m.1299 type:complete len:92 (+) Transcript_632:405-680(+)